MRECIGKFKMVIRAKKKNKAGSSRQKKGLYVRSWGGVERAVTF